MFNIAFLNKNVTSEEKRQKASYVEITIGNFKELILSSHDYWRREQYKNQWHEGLKRIIDGELQSCIIGSMYNPKKANFINMWPVYKIKNKIYIQNMILFLKEIKKPFDEKNIYSYIPSRVTVNEEGKKISEWHISIKDLMKFLNSHEN
jgi:hypothetical protein